MGKFSQKMMGKEVGSASVYAEPHTMGGVSLKGFGKEANSAKQSAAGSRIGDPNKQNALETSPTSGSKDSWHWVRYKGCYGSWSNGLSNELHAAFNGH